MDSSFEVTVRAKENTKQEVALRVDVRARGLRASSLVSHSESRDVFASARFGACTSVSTSRVASHCDQDRLEFERHGSGISPFYLNFSP